MAGSDVGLRTVRLSHASHACLSDLRRHPPAESLPTRDANPPGVCRGAHQSRDDRPRLRQQHSRRAALSNCDQSKPVARCHTEQLCNDASPPSPLARGARTARRVRRPCTGAGGSAEQSGLGAQGLAARHGGASRIHDVRSAAACCTRCVDAPGERAVQGASGRHGLRIVRPSVRPRTLAWPRARKACAHPTVRLRLERLGPNTPQAPPCRAGRQWCFRLRIHDPV